MNDTQYTRLSALAVTSFVLGALSLLAFFALPVAVLAIVAITLALGARRSMRRYELLGFPFVVGGLCLSITCLVLAPVWHLHRYNSEALPDHDRIDFAAVADKDRTDLDEYDNQRICLKGYAQPSQRIATDTLFFSPNGDDRPEHGITVELPFTWGWRSEAIAVSGTLQVNHKATTHAARYILKATAIRVAQTSYDLAPRVPGKGC